MVCLQNVPPFMIDLCSVHWTIYTRCLFLESGQIFKAKYANKCVSPSALSMVPECSATALRLSGFNLLELYENMSCSLDLNIVDIESKLCWLA